MAVPACLRLADEVFPRARAGAARRLLAAGWSQTRAAKALGISQPLVSKLAGQAPVEDGLVARLAEDLAQELLASGAGAGTASALSSSSPSSSFLSSSGPWCATLGATNAPGGGAALEDLLAAERLLRERLGGRLVPEIGMNIVRALPDAATARDVLGYPARLVHGGARLLAPAPPELGGSGHLAHCLLALREAQPATWALASLRGGPQVLAAARSLGWDVAQLPLAGPAAGESRFRHAARSHADATALHDPGPPGIEPCLYLAAGDCRAVAERILLLQTALRAHDVKP